MLAAMRILPVLLLAVLVGPAPTRATHAELEAGWLNPPRESRLRAYWWWLNGNVTTSAITRDLEQMKAQGFGGALICDADGSAQDGNTRVPHGPTFLSPAWRALYRHALREADRLGLEMSLNIQSGWNLGGPMVTADEAPKLLVWSETSLEGGRAVDVVLPRPPHKKELYRDIAVLAVPAMPSGPAVRASARSAQADHAAADASDGRLETFWVSGQTEPGRGPTDAQPEWLQLERSTAFTAAHLRVVGRPAYGPRAGRLLASPDGRAFTAVAQFAAAPADAPIELDFPAVTARFFRLEFTAAHDPKFPASPRNVQVAEWQLAGPGGDRLDMATRAALPPTLTNAVYKTLGRVLHFSAPDCRPLMRDEPEQAGEPYARTADTVELTARMDDSGRLRWDAPAGPWQVIRLGYTLNDHCRVSTCSEGWDGYALDPMDAHAFARYWTAVVDPLIADAGPLAGSALRYLHTDSWEVENMNWTAGFREEFNRRRGYDLLPFLPVLLGRVMNSREQSNRFLHDFRQTIGDLAVDHHYRPFRDRAHQAGLEIHPESGGPHAVPIDAQRCLGINDVPMSEFWAWSPRHRIGDANRFFVKQPASAAHTYGRKAVAAEGFTTIGRHWQERLWDNLKPAFDKAACEGLNLLVWHAFTCSPDEQGRPGQEYFAGTHFNPQSTWWSRSGPFLAYINRCQFLLQHGRFVADAAFYYGDHVPNFAQRKASDPAQVGPGRDYDVISAEALVERLRVRDGLLEIPDGPAYRVLVLTDLPGIALPVLQKVRDLVHAGATVIGSKPRRANTLTDFPQCDRAIAALADELWGPGDAAQVERRVGRGRVIAGRTAAEVLAADGVPADFTWRNDTGPAPDLDVIHRTDGETDIYFVAQRAPTAATVTCTFRVGGRAPEIWDPVSGQRRFAARYRAGSGVTEVPLDFAPCGSWFVVFRAPAAAHPPAAEAESGARTVRLLDGPWAVSFDPRMGGPTQATFAGLCDWTTQAVEGIRYYAGSATYRAQFDLPSAGPRRWLDLGDVRELAEVRLNGRPLGIVWTPPFRVDITDAARAGHNELEVDVVNFWANRVIGDARQAAGAPRFTRTNIRRLCAQEPLMSSGLLGPVQLLEMPAP